MGIEVQLRDGTRGWVVPLQHGDKAELAKAFEELSPESRRQRFLTPVERLSDAMLAHLVDDVDGIDHVAYVLTAETDEDVFDPVAIARAVRYADMRDAADVAVTVKEAWQGRGVASALLTVLVAHRPEGVRRFVTEVADGNAASLAMLRALGPTTVSANGYGAYDVVVELEPDAEPDAQPDQAQPESGSGSTGEGDAVETPAGGVPIHRPRVDRKKRQHFQTRDAVCPWLN